MIVLLLFFSLFLFLSFLSSCIPQDMRSSSLLTCPVLFFLSNHATNAVNLSSFRCSPHHMTISTSFHIGKESSWATNSMGPTIFKLKIMVLFLCFCRERVYKKGSSSPPCFLFMTSSLLYCLSFMICDLSVNPSTCLYLGDYN